MLRAVKAFLRKIFQRNTSRNGRRRAVSRPTISHPLPFTVQPATHEAAGGRSSPEVAQQPQEQTKPSRPYMSVSVPAMQLLPQRESEEPTARPSYLKRSASLALSLEMQWASICEAVSTPLWKSASVPKHLNLLSSATTIQKTWKTLGRPFSIPRRTTSLPNMYVLAKSEAAFGASACPTTLREKVLHELLSTERIYGKQLKDIIEVCIQYNTCYAGLLSYTHMQGYLVKCRQHTMLFQEKDISTIFSNIEEIYQLHVNILSEFEQQGSSIGEVFIKNVRLSIHCLENVNITTLYVQMEAFAVYSKYCQNHPKAVQHLASLQDIKFGQYKYFFEVGMSYLEVKGAFI